MVERTPNIITTVSGMQRQLQDMDLLSAGNSIRTSLLEAPLSRNVSMAYTYDNNDESESVSGEGARVIPLYDVPRFTQTHYDIAKRYLQNIQDYIQGTNYIQFGMQGAGNPPSILGGKPGSSSTVSESSQQSNKYIAKSSTSLSSIGVGHAPLSMQWNLGVALYATKDPKLMILHLKHSSFGCTICQGFGHSTTNCLTEFKLKLLLKGQPLYSHMNKTVRESMSKVWGVYNDKWLYGDMMGIMCSNERAEAELKKTDEGYINLIMLVNVLANELQSMQILKCVYCDGYGHRGTDSVTIKLGKRPFEREGAKIIQYNKSKYANYNDHCYVKNSLEEDMLSASTEQRMNYTTVMQEQRNKAQQTYQEQTGKINFNQTSSMQDIVSYIGKSVYSKKFGTQKVVQVVDITDRATTFEKACVSHADIIKSMPKSKIEAEQQQDVYEEEILQVSFDTVTAQSDLPLNEQRQQKVVILSSRWIIMDDTDGTELTTRAWNADMSVFPLISFKNRKAYPKEATTLLMLAWVIENRTNFVGIPENFKIPTGFALKNFYVSIGTLNLRPMSALFQSKSALNQGLSLFYEIERKLKAAGITKDFFSKATVSQVNDTLVAGYEHKNHVVDYKVTVFPYFQDCKTAIDKLQLEVKTKYQIQQTAIKTQAALIKNAQTAADLVANPPII